MPSADLLIAFFIATCVYGFMPGPGMLYASAQTLARGRKAGWLAALGLHLGGYAHVLAAALGLAFLFQAVPSLYLVLKFAGAAYLIWLGIKLLRSRTMADDTGAILVDAKSPRRAFWESMTVEMLNPKTAIFYVTFLPQFTDPAASLPMAWQLFILGTIVNIVFSSGDAVCVLLADRVTSLIRQSRRAGHVLQKIGGGILVALGLNVALSRS